MNLISWNYRGLGNQRAVNVLSHLVRQKAPKILFLMETKRTVEEMQWIQEDLPYRCMLAMPCTQRRGGLALLWKEEIKLHIQTYSPHHIDALILNDEQHPWRLTRFYGWPEESRKKESWQLLKHLHTRLSVPWLCCGDFNEILNSNGKQGRLPKQQQPMIEFRSTLLYCGLVDLGFQGSIFTWNNGRLREEFVQECLDRVCATLEWRTMFPHAKVTHLQSTYSDHIPILKNLSRPNQ